MVIVSVSLFVVSVTEVAVITGALFGAAGAVPGGVYAMLVPVGPEMVPHVGEHAAPPAVSVQMTPAFPVSLVTVAFNVTAAAPAVMVEILLVIETETAGGVLAVIVNVTESLLVVSATDVAVIVTEFVAGGVAGAVYITEVVVVELIVPAPVAGAIVQVTPSSAESLVTEAVSVAVEPATTDVGLFAITTLTAFEAGECPLHPAAANTHIKAAIHISNLELVLNIYGLLAFLVVAAINRAALGRRERGHSGQSSRAHAVREEKTTESTKGQFNWG